MKGPIAVFVAGMVGLMPAAHPAAGQTPEVTAGDVVDAETLEAFVEGARTWSEAFTDPNDFPSYVGAISTEGDWKHGNTYLILMLPNGTVIIHTDDPTVNGKNLYEAEDARGNKVVQALLAAAGTGGHVEYYWDDPEQEGDEEEAKTAYATSYTSGTTATPVVLIGGYYQDPSHAVAATFDPSIIAPPPPRSRPPTWWIGKPSRLLYAGR